MKTKILSIFSLLLVLIIVFVGCDLDTPSTDDSKNPITDLLLQTQEDVLELEPNGKMYYHVDAWGDIDNLSEEDIALVSDNPEIANIVLNKIEKTTIYIIVEGVSEGSTFVCVTTSDGTVSSRKLEVHVASKETPTTTEKPTTTATKATQPPISLKKIPAYSNSPYVAINNNNPSFSSSDYTTSSYESYSPLDKLGRCGVCEACVGTDLMPTEERGNIGMVKPSGWHTVRYDNVDGSYLYNRCHLIGYQLSGENANECNLITGTRYMNVVGMLQFEDMVADFVKDTGYHVLYRVTPIFEGDNLVANGVQMEGYSVEDQGDGISFNVFCYNVQPGIQIDYASGDSHLVDVVTTKKTEAKITEAAVVSSEGNGGTITYVLNTNTHKFHYPTCGSVKQMKDKNKKVVNWSRDEVINAGYKPCGNCHP